MSLSVCLSVLTWWRGRTKLQSNDAVHGDNQSPRGTVLELFLISIITPTKAERIVGKISSFHLWPDLVCVSDAVTFRVWTQFSGASIWSVLPPIISQPSCNYTEWISFLILTENYAVVYHSLKLSLASNNCVSSQRRGSEHTQRVRSNKAQSEAWVHPPWPGRK